MHSQDQNLDRGILCTDALASLQAIHAGHADIENDHIWLEMGYLVDGVGASAGLSHDLNIRLSL
jgi:hypothetical protein